jgi:chromosome segregation ATPase
LTASITELSHRFNSLQEKSNVQQVKINEQEEKINQQKERIEEREAKLDKQTEKLEKQQEKFEEQKEKRLLLEDQLREFQQEKQVDNFEALNMSFWEVNSSLILLLLIAFSSLKKDKLEACGVSVEM